MIGVRIMNWMIHNIEWIFSGIGVTLIICIITFVFKCLIKKRSKKNEGSHEYENKNKVNSSGAVISQNNVPMTVGRDAIIGSNIVVHNETISPIKLDAQVEIVDVEIGNIFGRTGEGAIPLGTYIDVKLRNKGDNVAFLSGVVFEIQEVFRLDDPRGVRYSPVPFTETYDISLKSDPDSIQQFSMSQVVKSNDVDRFRLKVVSDESFGRIEVVYKFSLSFIYNEDKKMAFAGKHIAVFPPQFTPGGWSSLGLDYSTWKSNYDKLTDIRKKCEAEGDVTISKIFKGLIDGYEHEAKLSKEELMSIYGKSIFINMYGHIPKEQWENIDRQIKKECKEVNETKI